LGAAREGVVPGIEPALMELDGEPWWKESRLVAVGEPLADWLLTEDPPNGTAVRVEVKGQKLAFQKEAN